MSNEKHTISEGINSILKGIVTDCIEAEIQDEHTPEFANMIGSEIEIDEGNFSDIIKIGIAQYRKENEISDCRHFSISFDNIGCILACAQRSLVEVADDHHTDLGYKLFFCSEKEQEKEDEIRRVLSLDKVEENNE